MIPISSLDAAMLYAETKEMPMHTMGVLLLEPPSVSGVSGFAMMRLLLKQRIHLFPSLRRRLVQDPLQLGDPYWLDDPHFDLDAHLKSTTLSAPGSMRELEAYIGNYASQRLSRDRALWELVWVEGLEGGRLAVVCKFHHAAMDGARLVELIEQLCEPTPTPPKESVFDDPWVPEREPSIRWLAADTLRTLAGKPLRAAKAATALTASLTRRRAPAPQREGPTEPESSRKTRLFEAPATPFNGALSTKRAVALSDVSLDDLKHCGHAFGTTLNDVVLAACCGSLRSWLLSHGGLPDRPLIATVPVAVRLDGDEAGNRVSMIRAHLPLDIADPAARLLAIHQETHRKKRRHARGGGGDVFRHFTDIAINVSVPWLLIKLLGFYSSSHLADHVPPLWNLVISNMRGPQDSLYFGGSKLLRVYPLGPIQQGSGINITVMSTADRLCFGAVACPELVPDLDAIASGFRDEVATLRALC